MRKRLFIVVLVLLVLTVSSGAVYLFYIFPKIGKTHKKPDNENINSTINQTENEDAFGDIIKRKEFTDEYTHTRNIVESNSLQFALQVFGTLLTVPDFPDGVNYNNILPTGGMVVKTENMDGVIKYKVISSKNINYNEGESLKFSPVIDQKSVFIIDYGKRTLYTIWELPNFKFPESLKESNRIIMLCNVEDCSDNKLLWAFVY